jgi:hypothetical protein
LGEMLTTAAGRINHFHDSADCSNGYYIVGGLEAAFDV